MDTATLSINVPGTHYMVAHFLRGFSYSIPIGGGLLLIRVSGKERKGPKIKRPKQDTNFQFALFFMSI